MAGSVRDEIYSPHLSLIPLAIFWMMWKKEMQEHSMESKKKMITLSIDGFILLDICY